jgi:hypothetical protein
VGRYALRQRPLFWVAVGAGLAAMVFLIVDALPLVPHDQRFLDIAVQPGSPAQGAAIAAVGQCRARFTAIMPGKVFVLRIPLKSLDTPDFACLIDTLHTIPHDLAIHARAAAGHR